MRQTVQIIAAHPLEVKELRKRFGCGAFRLSESGGFILQDTPIKISLSGIGREKVESIYGKLFRKDILPSHIVNIGFAGALETKTNWGCWILCDQIHYFDRGSIQGGCALVNSKLVEEARDYFACSEADYHIGSLVTVNRVCSDQESKGQLFKATAAMAVDMEAYHIAQIAKRRNVPFIAVKIISDEVSELAENVIKSRGRVLSRRIAQVIPELITRMVSPGDDKRSYSHIQ